MNVTIEIDESAIRQCATRILRDSLGGAYGEAGSALRAVVGEAIKEAFIVELVRPIVQSIIESTVREYAKDRIEDAIQRMVRKVVAEKKDEIAKQLEMK